MVQKVHISSVDTTCGFPANQHTEETVTRDKTYIQEKKINLHHQSTVSDGTVPVFVCLLGATLCECEGLFLLTELALQRQL